MNNDDQCIIFNNNKKKKIQRIMENKNYNSKNDKSFFSNIISDLKHLFSPVIEGLDKGGNTSQDVLMSEYNSDIQEINNLDQKFQKTLDEYQKEYTQYLTNLESQEDSINEIYKNKVISVIQKNADGTDTMDTKYYYINNLGVKRPFNNSVNYKDCKDTMNKQDNNPVSVMSSDADKLVTGFPMNSGEKCSWGAGYNVSDASNSNNIYWVDMKGGKNKYSSIGPDGRLKKNESCPTNFRVLTPSEVNSIPLNRSKFTITDKCEYINLDSSQWDKVNNINNKLMGIVKKIKEKNDKLIDVKKKLGVSNIIATQDLNLVNTQLNNKKSILKDIEGEMENIRANLENRKLDTTSLQYKNALFALSMIIMIYFTIKHFN